MRSELLFCSILLAVLSTVAVGADNPVSQQTPAYQIAVYYWPSWHVNPLYDAKKGKGWMD